MNEKLILEIDEKDIQEYEAMVRSGEIRISNIDFALDPAWRTVATYVIPAKEEGIMYIWPDMWKSFKGRKDGWCFMSTDPHPADVVSIVNDIAKMPPTNIVVKETISTKSTLDTEWIAPGAEDSDFEWKLMNLEELERRFNLKYSIDREF
jgi:hypothetical protein